MLVRRRLGIQLTLDETGDEDFEPLNEAGSRTLTLDGFRADCIIDMTGQAISMSRLEMRIYGMSRDMMTKFMTKRLNPLAERNDIITITAGDDVNGMHQVFAGNILTAVPNFDGMPESSFDITAQAGYFHQVNPAAANTYPNAVDVATIVASLAKRMGYTFRNNGVTAKLSNQNISGTLLDQLSTVVEATGIVCTMNNGVITIFPNDGGTEAQGYRIGPESGLVGYPVYTQTGVDITTLFNPDLSIGDQVDLVTEFPDAAGREWRVQNMRHELSSVTVDGRFFTRVQLGKAGIYVPRF